jgi:hypothetical protein
MSAPRRHHTERPPQDAPPWRRRAKPAAPRDVAAPRFVGDRAMVELRQRLALDVEAVPQPPFNSNGGRSIAGLALRFGAVVMVAALAAWTVVSFSRAHLSADEVREARVAAAPAPTKVKLVNVHTGVAAARPALVPIGTPAASHVTLAAEEKAPAPASIVPLPLQQPSWLPGISIAVKTPEPAPPMASTAGATNKSALAPDDIATLIRRGKAFMTDGDVVAARLLLQRAAEAGNAEAALALGASFDPLIIKQAGGIGVQTDAAQARQWYQKAAALGSAVATKQLANLASTGQ